jgi:hypothetical protein
MLPYVGSRCSLGVFECSNGQEIYDFVPLPEKCLASTMLFQVQIHSLKDEQRKLTSEHDL